MAPLTPIVINNQLDLTAASCKIEGMKRLVILLLLAVVVSGCASAGRQVEPKNADSGKTSQSAQNANISFNFPGIPLRQLLDVYEQLAGKKVTMEGTPKEGPALRVIPDRLLTKSEALQLLEEVLKEQAGLVIVHGPDGSLTAVAKPQDCPH